MATFKKDIYCEFEFLKKFRDSFVPICQSGDTKALRMWLNISQFISKSRIKIDVDDSEFKGQIQSFSGDLNLIKKYTQGEIHCSNIHKYECVDNLLSKPKERLKTAFLIDKVAGICKMYAKKYGVVVVSPLCWNDSENADKSSYLFADCGISINEGDKIEWGKMLKEDYNLSDCNAMIVIDNYILQDVNNLKRVIEQFLPKPMEGFKREHEFYVTVITGKAKNNPNRNDKHIYEQLVEDIKQSHPDLNCHIDLFVEQVTMSHTFHDRHILTNNVFITIGGGFDSFDKHGKAKKQTSTSLLHPGIQSVRPACDDEYMNIINRTCYKVVNCTNEGQWKHFPENECCRNRLIVSSEND